MIEVLEYLGERKDEFDRHLAIARMLQNRMDKGVGEGDILVEVRHINTIKSGLIIHLYNIVEAVTSKTLQVVGQTVIATPPANWKDDVLHEWVRSMFWNEDGRVGESALRKLTGISRSIVSGDYSPEFKVKGEPGSWDDDAIKKVAKRLGCKLSLLPEIRRLAFEEKFMNETTAMRFLAYRRNAIAHGSTTFEEGAQALTLDELADLANRILPFLEAVAKCYEAYLRNGDYLRGEAA